MKLTLADFKRLARSSGVALDELLGDEPLETLARGNKYHARRTVRNGRSFPSTLEADYGDGLKLLERAGEISDLEFQPRVELEPGFFYKPDFRFVERGRVVHVEAKGVRTGRYRLICKLWRLHGPTVLREVARGRHGSFVVVREIPPAPPTVCPTCGHVAEPFAGQTTDQNARHSRGERAGRAQV